MRTHAHLPRAHAHAGSTASCPSCTTTSSTPVSTRACDALACALPDSSSHLIVGCRLCMCVCARSRVCVPTPAHQGTGRRTCAQQRWCQHSWTAPTSRCGWRCSLPAWRRVPAWGCSLRASLVALAHPAWPCCQPCVVCPLGCVRCCCACQVVDVGGGTGFCTLGIVQSVERRNVTLIDQSPHQLAKAKGKPALRDVTIMEVCERGAVGAGPSRGTSSGTAAQPPRTLTHPRARTPIAEHTRRRATPRTCPLPPTALTATCRPAASSTGALAPQRRGCRWLAHVPHACRGARWRCLEGLPLRCQAQQPTPPHLRARPNAAHGVQAGASAGHHRGVPRDQAGRHRVHHWAGVPHPPRVTVSMAHAVLCCACLCVCVCVCARHTSHWSQELALLALFGGKGCASWQLTARCCCLSPPHSPPPPTHTHTHTTGSLLTCGCCSPRRRSTSNGALCAARRATTNVCAARAASQAAAAARAQRPAAPLT
jgi:hypothetical protein